MTWNEHMKMRRAIIGLSAAQYEYCRLRGHKIEDVPGSDVGEGYRWVRCRMCGCTRIVEAPPKDEPITAEKLRLVVNDGCRL